MSQLLDIQPSRELQFIFEVKKQSTCNVQLTNKTDQHVAFKIKTTSPKKYCVRPNVGIILPKETREFLVIMQAHRSPPPDMICKDKFLVQSTIVPDGTTGDDVKSDMFSKEDGKYVEERKLKVILVSSPHSPELAPMNGKLKQVPPVESSLVADELVNRTERHSLHHADVEHVKELKLANEEVQKPMADAEPEAVEIIESDQNKVAEPVVMRDLESQPVEVVESNSLDKVEARTVKAIEPKMIKDAEDLTLAKDVEKMKSTLLELESKLGQAEKTISKLIEERRLTIQERESLQQELALLRTQRVQKTVHDGFPLLYVCMVAIISVVLGYLLHL